MPQQATVEKARRDKREGKAPSTQAGQFVREEIRHIRDGKHGARSAKQAIAIGLSKARRAGVDLKPPRSRASSERPRKRATRAHEAGHIVAPARAVNAKRARASEQALKREPRAAAGRTALAKQAHRAAAARSPAARAASARKAAHTRAALR